MRTMVILCNTCHKALSTNKPAQKFCSYKCRMEAKKIRKEKKAEKEKEKETKINKPKIPVSSYETLEMRKVFEMFYVMGEKRSLKAVAKKLNKPLQRIIKWSNKFDWADRVIARDKAIAEEMSKEVDGIIIDQKTMFVKELKEYLEINRKLLLQAIEKINIKEIKIRSIDNLHTTIASVEKLIKLIMLLSGENLETTPQVTVIEIGMPNNTEKKAEEVIVIEAQQADQKEGE